MTTPRISVLLPVFDAEPTLEACLTSILRQHFEDWECLLVDDGSSDRSLAIARDFAADDRRIRVEARPHSGLVSTLQHGVACSRAPAIARMDADDLMHSDRLGSQLDALEAGGFSAVGCHVRMFPRTKLRDGMRSYEQWLGSICSPEDILREAFIECPIAHPTWMLRRDICDAFPYRDMGWPEDYDLLLRLLSSGEPIGMVPRRLLSWRQGEGRLSMTSPAYSEDRFTACKAAYLAEGLLRGRSHYALWGYGATGRKLCRALDRKGRRPSTIVEMHPRRVGRMIQGAPVISPEDLSAPLPDPMLVSVSGSRARNEIRAHLREKGFEEGLHFVCCA